MEEIKKYFKDCSGRLEESVVISRKAIVLEVLLGFLSGIILGILIAPAKYRKVGCNNGNNCVGKCTTKNYGKDCDCECDCDCDCEKKEDEE
jgi:hypothetical protein